jgi:hypothetical protein
MSTRIIGLAAGLMLGLLVGSCGLEEDCDPLAAREEVVQLTEVIAVGEDDGGVLFVLSEVRSGEAGEQVLVSEGERLRKLAAAGSGSGGDASGSFYSISVLDGDYDFTLLVIDPNDGDLQMAIAPGEHELREWSELPDDAEILTVRDESVIDGMGCFSVVEMEVEYYIEVPGGEVIVVLRPDRDWDYDDFRLFLGPGGDLIEYRVTDVVRYTDGGTTTIDFRYEGGQATMYCPYVDMGWGQATLTRDGETVDVERLPTDELDTDTLTFACRE